MDIPEAKPARAVVAQLVLGNCQFHEWELSPATLALIYGLAVTLDQVRVLLDCG